MLHNEPGDNAVETTLKKHKSHHTTRKRFAYKGNQVASLSLAADNQTIVSLAANHEAFFNHSKNNMLFHAANRVDLFFYILIAYFKTGLTPQKGSTYIQYGKGRNLPDTITSITQANHSSLLSCFVDEVHAAYPIENKDKPKSLLFDTHFLRSLNSTVELPSYINALDNAIETTDYCRERALAIIQAVAKGTDDPINGLAKFFQLLENIFTQIKTAFLQTPLPSTFASFNNISLNVRQDLFALMERGTFEKKWNRKNVEVEPDYIELLLRLSLVEKTECKKNPAFKKECYEKKMLALQQEILDDKIHFSYDPLPNVSI